MTDYFKVKYENNSQTYIRKTESDIDEKDYFGNPVKSRKEVEIDKSNHIIGYFSWNYDGDEDGEVHFFANESDLSAYEDEVGVLGHSLIRTEWVVDGEVVKAVATEEWYGDEEDED